MKEIEITFNVSVKKTVLVPNDASDVDYDEIIDKARNTISAADIANSECLSCTWKSKDDQPYYIGIILNWKGLKEENYLYSFSELTAMDSNLAIACLSEPDEWHDSTLCNSACKTWQGKLLKTSEEISDFLSGKYNDSENQYSNCDDDWYWSNSARNDLYGVESNTLLNLSNELRTPGIYNL